MVWQGKVVTGFVSNKARALLIYLAVTGRTHSRDALAELLWPDMPLTARVNLRKTLSNMRNLPGVELREESTDSVALELDKCWIDVVEFEQRVAGGIDELDALRHTVQLYQADFLSGFNTSLSYEFEAWVLAKRNDLRTQMIRLLDRLVDSFEQARDLAQAIAIAHRLLELEPGREETHRRVMSLLVRSGDRRGALAQFHLCVSSLKAELDVAPALETSELYEQIRAGTYPRTDPSLHSAGIIDQRTVEAPAPTPYSNLPIPATQLVGRQQVLSDITQLLQHDEVRLVTLTGTGGVGKTRVAIQAGHNLAGEFTDGVVFVELASIQSPALVPVAIADALGIRESVGNRPLQEHMAAYLRDKRLLLIIDSFEHVVRGAPIISALLAKASQVRVLVTSREVLRVQGEHEYHVPPLDLPTNMQYIRQQQLDEVEAIQLFVLRARSPVQHHV